VLLVEMGHMNTTAILVNVSSDCNVATIVNTINSNDLGGYHFDMLLFEHLSNICKTKHHTTVCVIYLLLYFIIFHSLGCYICHTYIHVYIIEYLSQCTDMIFIL
jgi:hypothetical protein